MQKVVVKTDRDTTGGLSMFPNLGTSGACLVDLQVHVPASRNTSPWKASVFVSGSPAIHAPASCRLCSSRVDLSTATGVTLCSHVLGKLTHTHTHSREHVHCKTRAEWSSDSGGGIVILSYQQLLTILPLARTLHACLHLGPRQVRRRCRHSSARTPQGGMGSRKRAESFSDRGHPWAESLALCSLDSYVGRALVDQELSRDEVTPGPSKKKDGRGWLRIQPGSLEGVLLCTAPAARALFTYIA